MCVRCLADCVRVRGWVRVRWEEEARTHTRSIHVSIHPSHPWTHTHLRVLWVKNQKKQVKALLTKEKLPFVGVINNAGLLQVGTNVFVCFVCGARRGKEGIGRRGASTSCFFSIPSSL